MAFLVSKFLTNNLANEGLCDKDTTSNSAYVRNLNGLPLKLTIEFGAYDAGTVPSVSGLIKRGVITTSTYIDKKGKNIPGANMGKAYLKNI